MEKRCGRRALGAFIKIHVKMYSPLTLLYVSCYLPEKTCFVSMERLAEAVRKAKAKMARYPW
jgi:hypothetical protein